MNEGKADSFCTFFPLQRIIKWEKKFTLQIFQDHSSSTAPTIQDLQWPCWSPKINGYTFLVWSILIACSNFSYQRLVNMEYFKRCIALWLPIINIYKQMKGQLAILKTKFSQQVTMRRWKYTTWAHSALVHKAVQSHMLRFQRAHVLIGTSTRREMQLQLARRLLNAPLLSTLQACPFASKVWNTSQQTPYFFVTIIPEIMITKTSAKMIVKMAGLAIATRLSILIASRSPRDDSSARCGVDVLGCSCVSVV